MLPAGLALAFSPAALSEAGKSSERVGRIVRIGLLSIGTEPGRIGRWAPFIEEMSALGYVEGRNLVIHQAFGAGRADHLSRLVASLVDAKVDVIVTTGTREIAAAKSATAAIPVVMTLAPDPVGQGFAASLSRPGGNLTGFTSLVPGLTQKYVELLHEAVPAASRLAIFNLPPNPTPGIQREIEIAAKALGIAVFVVRPSDASDMDRAMRQAKAEGAAGIIHALDGGATPHRKALVSLALKHGLPGMYWDAEYVEQGGLMSYSINFADILRRAASFVDRILRGARPADMPIEQPTRFELVVNRRTAKALGLEVPQSILIRADRVID